MDTSGLSPGNNNNLELWSSNQAFGIVALISYWWTLSISKYIIKILCTFKSEAGIPFWHRGLFLDDWNMMAACTWKKCIEWILSIKMNMKPLTADLKLPSSSYPSVPLEFFHLLLSNFSIIFEPGTSCRQIRKNSKETYIRQHYAYGCI